MAKFTVTVYNPADHTHERQLEYDNSISTLIWADTQEPVLTDIEVADQPDVGQIKIPMGKQPTILKIQLGLECNLPVTTVINALFPIVNHTILRI